MLSQDDICTYCLRRGHRASHCPMRPAAEVARAVGTLLGSIAGRAFARLVQAGNRLACHATACRQVFRFNVQGRYDSRPLGVWECSRCGRIRLGKAIPNQPYEESP